MGICQDKCLGDQELISFMWDIGSSTLTKMKLGFRLFK